MSLYTRKFQLLAALEDTKGTAQSLSASDGLFNIFDLEPDPDVPTIDRPQQGTTNHLQHSYGPMSARVKFKTELVGSGASGAVPAWASTFLPACGWLNTAGTFAKSDVFADQRTITMKCYIDGLVRTIIGAVGTFSIILKHGQKHDVMFDFLGKIAPEADASIPSVTEPTVIPPRGLATCTMNATAIEFGQFTINSGGVPQLLEQPANDTNSTGWSHGCIPDFRPTGTLDPRSTIVATKNWWTEFTGLQERAISMIAGSSANNTITIASSTFQIEVPKIAKRGGVETRALTGKFNQGFTIAFS